MENASRERSPSPSGVDLLDIFCPCLMRGFFEQVGSASFTRTSNQVPSSGFEVDASTGTMLSLFIQPMHSWV